MKIGAHLSASGGYTQALVRASDIGANCLQLFSSSPRIWKTADITDESAHEFVLLKQKLEIDPVYFHASYLINLAGNDRLLNLSKNALIVDLNLASKLDIRGTIVHTGSYKEDGKEVSSDIKKKKYEMLITTIQDILKQTPENTLLMIENAGNKKIGATLEEIGEIIRDVDSARIRVCIDTCHAHAAGYDFSTQESLNEFLNMFEKVIGLSRLEVFQVNDSRDPFGSFRDRHENIGEGTMGIEPFALLLQDKRILDRPFILEVPGFDHNGPDAKNIEILKNLTQM